MKTFEEVNRFLRRYWPANLGRRAYTLEYMAELMDYLDNPQDKLKVVHVAGTSGKTSTAYYAAALLKAAGKKVGLSASPHVEEINERVQLNLVPMPEAEYCKELSAFVALVEKGGLQPTYFELLVGFAFWQYARRGMEYAVIEVGLGGLTDATNVITRTDKTCIITDIGLDHLNVLGSSLAEIAEHKAGIIQLHNSVFCYKQAKVVMEQIEARARQKQADLHVLPASAAESRLDTLPLFQQRNLGLASAAVNHLLEADGAGGVTPRMLLQAAKTHIPARMETFKHGDKIVILDGAHNAQKLRALAESIKQKYPRQNIAVVVALTEGRSFRLEDATEELTRLADHLIVTTFSGPKDGPHRSEEAEVIGQLLRKHGAQSVELSPRPRVAFDKLLKRPEPVLLVTGSFYLLNHIRPLQRSLKGQ